MQRIEVDIEGNGSSADTELAISIIGTPITVDDLYSF
jgi:hypothetical protein